MGEPIPHHHGHGALQLDLPEASHQHQGLIQGARLRFPFELPQQSVHKAYREGRDIRNNITFTVPHDLHHALL